MDREKETERDALNAAGDVARVDAWFLTAEFAIGKNMPIVKMPSNGPAVIPDKLFAA